MLKSMINLRHFGVRFIGPDTAGEKTKLVTGFMLIILLALSTGLMADGTEPTGNPREVSTLDHLLWISTNSSSWGDDFIQMNDIDAAATSTWNSGAGFSPIGNFTTSFTGQYDGAGFTIDNLYINRSSTNFIGLFGEVENGTIENLGIINCNLTGLYQIGGLVGAINPGCTVNNCYSTGIVNGEGTIGGLIGRNYGGSLSTCCSSVNVTGTNHNLGGFVGWNDNAGVIENSYSTGNVNGDSNNSSDVGGFVGDNSSGTTNGCYSLGSVNGYSANGGGFVGFSFGYGENDCFWNTTTSGMGSSAGGTGKTDVEMKDVATFTAWYTSGLDHPWDFVGTPHNDYHHNDYWNITPDLNGGYPYLVWQYVSAPAVSNSSPTNVGATSATLNGEITDNGSEDPTVTIYWGDNDGGTTPTNWDDSINKGTQSGTFSSGVSSLNPNTTYYYRCYAENSAGSDWANTSESFTTLQAPTVTTSNVTNISVNSATGNGNITDLGNPNPTQHGHCWSTSSNPDINDNKTTLGSASSTGTFTSNISGLSPGQTYYVRAYATNDAGTSYGSGKTFTTLQPGLWTGTTSSDWSTASNWDDGTVPTGTVDVTIPSGCTNYPTIDETANCQSITIENGGEIDINSSYTLKINGNFTLQDGGSFTNNGTLKFLGTSKSLDDNRITKTSLGNIEVGN